MGSILLVHISICVSISLSFRLNYIWFIFLFRFMLEASYPWLIYIKIMFIKDLHLTVLQLFSQLTNWFIFFCFNRTLSNSLETVLTLVGLYHWPCMRNYPSKISLHSRKWGLIVAALACAIRPTSAIIWVYVGILELFLTRDRLRFVVLEVVPIG